MDWESAQSSGEQGELMVLLESLPRASWTARDDDGHTLLHFACQGPNVAATVALLQHGGINVRDQDGCLWQPAHCAVNNGQARVLEVLCAAGADLHARTVAEESVLELSLLVGSADCTRVLLVNGARLDSVECAYQHYASPWMEALVAGRARCRSVAIALLGLKRKRDLMLRSLDRFVVRELAWAIWATRGHAKWSD